MFIEKKNGLSNCSGEISIQTFSSLRCSLKRPGISCASLGTSWKGLGAPGGAGAAGAGAPASGIGAVVCCGDGAGAGEGGAGGCCAAADAAKAIARAAIRGFCMRISLTMNGGSGDAAAKAVRQGFRDLDIDEMPDEPGLPGEIHDAVVVGAARELGRALP